MSDAQPTAVEQTAKPEPPERFSMSFIRATEACLRRAHFEREGSVSGEPALIGSLFHEIAATAGFTVQMRGETMIDPGEALRIADRVLQNPEEPLTLPEHIYGEVRGLVGRWARTVTFREGEQFEINSRIPLEGRTLSARIDRLALVPEERAAYVRDYKTGWADPSKVLTTQGKVYGWHVLTTHPDVDVVHYCEEHVRFPAPPIPFEIHREELGEIEAFLRTAVKRIEAIYAAEGHLTTNPGSACMAFGRPCPVAMSCPVPEWARQSTTIDTEEQALEEFQALLVEEARSKLRKEAIRGYLEGAGMRVLQHEGEEIGWADKGGNSFDQAAALRAIEAAGGEPVARADFMKPTNPSYGRRKAK